MPKEANRSVALVVTTIASFLTPFMTSSVNIALPAIEKQFSMNAILLGWVPTSYILAAAIFLIPFGRVADIYGRRAIFLYGVVVYTASSFLVGVSNTTLFFLLNRVFQGIGSAMLFGTALAILTLVFPASERGKVLGINVAGVYLGLSLGPFLGGFLTQHFGWRTIFHVNGLLGVITGVLTFWKLRAEWVEAKGEQYDLLGTLMYMPALFLLMYGFSLLPARSGFYFVTLGIVLLVIFVFWESGCKRPVLNISLFRNNVVFSLSNLAALINYSATNAVGFLLSLYLQYIKGFTPQIAGTILFTQPLMMTILSPVAGKLSDRTEPRIVASLGMAMTAGGLCLLVFMKESTSVIFIVVSLAVLGFGFALFSSPNTNAVMSSVEKRFYGVASSTLGTMRLIGQMFSMGIVMFVFSLCIGRVRINPENYFLFLKSAKVLYAFFTLICCAGVFASLARGRLR